MLFYDVVPADAVSRSDFLSSIAEAGEEVRLPDFVTLSEFRSWLNALSKVPALTSDSGDEPDRSETYDMRMAELCTVLKV